MNRKKPAQPRAFTEALQAEVCQRIVAGETTREICASSHMPARSTLFATLATDADFEAAYSRAKRAQLAQMEEDLLEIADDGTRDVREDANGNEVVDHDVIARSRLRVDTRKWVMSKRDPKKYGEKVELEHGVTDALGDLMKAVNGRTRGIPGGS